MTNQRKAAPALYELIGRQTRVTSGTQIGGRGGSDSAARRDPPPHPATVARPHRAHDDDRAAAPPPLHIARPPVHSPGPSGPRPEPEVSAIEAPPAVALGPGRAVRVPAGYILFGAAAVIVLFIGGYMFGWSQKERELSDAERNEAALTASTLSEPPLEDPRPRQNPVPAGNTSTSTPPKQTAKPDATPKPSAQPTPPGVIVIGKGVADPRESGKNYAIVASLGQERAMELAEFMAKNGVAVGVFPRNNAGLYPVVSLTGYTREEFRAGTQKEHERRLRELGQQFAKLGGGRKDFSDLLWSKFSG